MTYTLLILDASKSKIPDNFSSKGREGVMEEKYVIGLRHCTLRIGIE